ncbi:hypothetical protein Pan44_27130 [Caulifigura coniformis]|uniref:Uncharacterized protein n=1 Tax=Caulifigura coniformis TaxID=2527983 RepID=A0A517SEZ9_9PLAN|nr:hypothetical protein [Caulifigura coniformis]QDT54678.1 hypothetical protein Pan44_27130 [Caulifigura coniformis]
MQLEHALLEIAEIRERMASTQVFRGYRAEIAAASGGLALLAAGLQGRIVTDPVGDIPGFVRFWSAVAALAIVATAIDLGVRWYRDGSGRERVRILNAVRALVPCLVTGALVTAVVVKFAPELGWTLPGLWSLLFAQGLFASTPLLPRSAWWVGGYYVAAGLVVLGVAHDTRALAGWTMGVTFGVGQLLAAAVLFFSLERRHGS